MRIEIQITGKLVKVRQSRKGESPDGLRAWRELDSENSASFDVGDRQLTYAQLVKLGAGFHDIVDDKDVKTNRLKST